MGYLLVFVGAGIGGLLRYLVSTTVQSLSDVAFPFGTLAVNMAGCLVIGLLAQLSESRGILEGNVRLFIFVGVLGGFTTFSSFGYETFQLLRDGQILCAAANAAAQVVLGIVFVWLGFVVGRLLC